MLNRLAQVLSFTFISTVKAVDDPPCNLWQVCAENDGLMPGDTFPSTPCKDPSAVTVPVFIENGYTQELMTPLGKSSMANACPFMDLTVPLCCNQDNAQIMEYNYKQLDAVFASDCPICAANLKRMWCEYACSSYKGNFLTDAGTRTVDGQLYQNVDVAIDNDYACGIYTSCAKESYIAQAGISSSVAFLDFMGTNGAEFSLSYINFVLVTDSTRDNALQGTMDEDWYPCEYPVPEDGTLLNFTGLANSTCSYCDAACKPPVVDDKIGFLDGFNWGLVGWNYLAFVLFTIIFQVIVHLCCKRQSISKMQATISAYETGEIHASGNKRGLGKPLNVTDSNNNSGLMSQDENRLEDRD